ncbi:MAG: FG-GAP repeat protein [Myxococcales bacterium]|nr:FG-GAP repeat protein [Myxococcales bacterium]
MATPTALGERSEAPSHALSDAPPSLRAAVIGAVQREAGPGYALDLAYDLEGARAYEANLATMRRRARFDKNGAALTLGGDEVELGLGLERAGCAGAARGVIDTEPDATQNQASYLHPIQGGRAVQAWYLTGPLGLEQGFTIEKPWGCEGELQLDVAVRGARVEAGRREGELLLVSDATGARFTYGELAAWDAAGKALPARMERLDGAVRLLVDATGAAYPVVVDPLVWVEEAKLTASDGATSDQLGISVAISADTALVGAYSDDVGANGEQGSAYVFVRAGAVWTQQAKLTASDGAPGDLFGVSVALSGDTALVGAHLDDVGANTNQGSAYVFVRAGAVWTQQAKLTAGDGAPSDRFGDAVALSGDTALVGAHSDDVGANTNQGSAYVFFRAGAVWAQQAKLTATDAASYDEFGQSVTLSGDTALVGASHDDVNQGSAYVFVRATVLGVPVWTQQAKLTASDGTSANFGHSVALSGDTALVGAFVDNGWQGSAYVFVRAGAVWTQQAKLTASDGAPSDEFGHSVALSGDTALVGAIYDDQQRGSAYAFVRAGAVWTQQAKLTASDGAPSDEFGYSVALSGDTALVGAIYDDQQRGSAYVFTLKKTNGDPCAAASECASGFCADGVCCNTACGGSAANDCQACSVAAGAAVDGTCSGTTGNTCSDGSVCTVTDTCLIGTCAAGSPVDCDDGNECTSETCDPATGCVVANVTDGASCEDGSVCSEGDTCQGGACLAGAGGPDCNDGNECTKDNCDSADPTNFCVHEALLGTPCDDGDACTVQNQCMAFGDEIAACGPGVALDCDDLNTCTTDDCDSASGCTHGNVPNGTPCESADGPGLCTNGACEVGTGAGGAGGNGGAGGSSSGDGGSGAAAGGGGGSGGKGGEGGGDDDTSADDGCGCAFVTAGDSFDPRAFTGVGLLLAIGLRRRRKAG